MAMLDYGAILKVDGVFVNKNEDFFMENMEKVVGFTLDSVTDEKGSVIPIDGEFFVYAGDKEMLLCFYKGECLVVGNDKIVKWLHTSFLEETFYFKNLPNVTISKLDKTPYIDEYGYKYYSYRFLATWEHNEHKYECIYGYGIDPDEETWNEIKYMSYGFSEVEVKIIDKWFKS